MSFHHNIAFQLDNPTLSRLITEQLSAIKGIGCDPSAPYDCVITNKAGFEANGDSSVLYIPKGTVRLGEIIDRLHYILSGRESHIEDDLSNLDLGQFTLIPSQNSLVHKESQQDIRLTDKERLLLRVLYQAGEAGLQRRDILKTVWGYADEAETHTLETHIYRLRQKLEPFAAQDIIRAADGCYILEIKNPPD
jgi:DNA-binding response OmpR family regulator